MESKLFKILLAIAFWAIPVALGYVTWWIINMIWVGALTSNWVMVLAGGLLAYLFFGLLMTGIIVFAVLALEATLSVLEDLKNGSS